MLKEYLTDKYFYIRYLSISLIVTLLLISAVLIIKDTHINTLFWLQLALIIPLMISDLLFILVTAVLYYVLFFFFYWQDLHFWYLGLVVLGALTGLYSTTLMHIATHNSIPNKFLNRLVGELCGIQQLITFNGWAVAHLIHHKYSDDPIRDPHPPQQFTYWQFANRMKNSTLKVLGDTYYEHFPDEPKAHTIVRFVLIISLINKFLRATFLLLLLGPIGFTLFYITSFVTQILFYTHFNYFTHRPTQNGEMEILNLYKGWYNRLINRFLFGIYFHKNHHRSPHLLNPSVLGTAEDDVYISYPVKEKFRKINIGTSE